MPPQTHLELDLYMAVRRYLRAGGDPQGVRGAFERACVWTKLPQTIAARAFYAAVLDKLDADALPRKASEPETGI